MAGVCPSFLSKTSENVVLQCVGTYTGSFPYAMQNTASEQVYVAGFSARVGKSLYNTQLFPFLPHSLLFVFGQSTNHRSDV